MASASSFWALFSCGEVAGEQPWASYMEQVAAARPFTMRNVQRRGSSIHTTFSLTFTCVPLPLSVPCTTRDSLNSPPDRWESLVHLDTLAFQKEA